MTNDKPLPEFMFNPSEIKIARRALAAHEKAIANFKGEILEHERLAARRRDQIEQAEAPSV